MKKLEDMNLVDDFLAYSLTAHKVYGEEASRYILQCILQREIRHLTVVPQKTWYGERPEAHGVRLDIYYYLRSIRTEPDGLYRKKWLCGGTGFTL